MLPYKCLEYYGLNNKRFYKNYDTVKNGRLITLEEGVRLTRLGDSFLEGEGVVLTLEEFTYRCCNNIISYRLVQKYVNKANTKEEFYSLLNKAIFKENWKQHNSTR